MMVMGVACVSHGFLEVGAIGTTFGTDASMAASDDGKWDDNRRLNEDVAKRKGIRGVLDLRRISWDFA